VAPNRLGLTIGPVLYHWPRQALMDFYAEVVETAADTVVIGEVVCARRRELRLPDWLALGRDLAAAGKTVVLAAQALIETEADLRLLERRPSRWSSPSRRPTPPRCSCWPAGCRCTWGRT